MMNCSFLVMSENHLGGALTCPNQDLDQCQIKGAHHGRTRTHQSIASYKLKQHRKQGISGTFLDFVGLSPGFQAGNLSGRIICANRRPIGLL